MLKRGLLIVLVFLLILNSFSGIVSAQETSQVETSTSAQNFDALEEEFPEAELSGAGITPDSSFYFVDELFGRFSGNIENKEEKIAEIKAMIEVGKIEEAKKALNSYRAHAIELEKDIPPEEREKARKSAAAIRRALKEIESQIPEEERTELFDDILKQEASILTAVEIAGKIKELCETLAPLDPLEYSRVCKTGDDAPEWQKKLHKDLTEEQKKEAREFGEIMSQCFKTSGRECSCEEINFVPMAEMCSTARPLAIACDGGNDEESCEKLDSLEFPEMPDYLEDILNDIEEHYSQDQFDLHIPSECREAGATTPEDCRKIMIRTHAPPECVEELEARDVKNEREARKICEKIMFEINAPQECIDAGITNPKECGKYMFEINAPQECIDAGLTGENRDDHKQCEKIMNQLRKNDFENGIEHRGPPGANCLRIESPEERLRCFEDAVQGFDNFEEQHREEYRAGFEENFEERTRETQERERQCAERCSKEGGAWDFIGGRCTCNFDNRGNYEEFREERRDEFSEPPPEFREGSNEFSEEQFKESENNFEEPFQEENSMQEPPQSPSEPSFEQESEPQPEPSPTTGAVIAVDNEFYNYYYN